jgi:hypothetical protein
MTRPSSASARPRLNGFGPRWRERRIAEGVTVRASREAVRRHIWSHWLVMSGVLILLRASPWSGP